MDRRKVLCIHLSARCVSFSCEKHGSMALLNITRRNDPEETNRKEMVVSFSGAVMGIDKKENMVLIEESITLHHGKSDHLWYASIQVMVVNSNGKRCPKRRALWK